MEVVETGELFSSHNGGLYSVLVDSFPGSRSLKVALPTTLHCDLSQFVNYSYNIPNDGIFTFSGEPNSLTNLDFTLNKVDLNDCTTSSGFVYEDLNQNGIKEAGEPGVSGVTLAAQNTGQSTFTDNNGYYEFQFSTPMEEAIEYVEHFRASCDGLFDQTIPAEGENIIIQTGMENENVNFGLTRRPNPGGLPCYDHKIVSFCVYTGVIPGNTFTTYLDTRTDGINANSSELRLNFDPALELKFADISPDEMGSDYLIWRFPPSEAPPAHCYQLRWRLHEDTDVGYILNWNANFSSTDYIEPTPDDNLMNRDKQVGASRRSGVTAEILSLNEKGFMPETLDSAEIQLSYMILFENNTLDSISDITIIDTLASELMASSLRKPFSSHPHEFKIVDNNILVWNFKDIALPSKDVNPGESFGFVQFNINLNEGVAPGTAFRNKATVIFNNSMMENTNEIIHRTPFVNSNHDERLSQDDFQVYPNPVHSKFNLEITDDNQSEYEIKVINSYGSVIYSKQTVISSDEINAESWASGLYLVKVIHKRNRKSLVKKLVKL